MYTVDCKDPNCIKCKQDPNGQCSGEMNQCKTPEKKEQTSEEKSQRELLKTLKEVIVKDLYDAVKDREECLSTCRKLKAEVHCKIDQLIQILRERELDLCLKIEKECCLQMQQIDQDVVSNCVNKITTCNGNLDLPSLPRCTPVFNCASFDIIKDALQNFGNVCFELPDGAEEKLRKELHEAMLQMVGKEPVSALSSDCSVKEDSKTIPNEKDAVADKQSNRVKVAKFEHDFKEFMCKVIKETDIPCKGNSSNNMKEKMSLDLEEMAKNNPELDQKLEHMATKLQNGLLARKSPKVTQQESVKPRSSDAVELFEKPFASRHLRDDIREFLKVCRNSPRGCVMNHPSFVRIFGDSGELESILKPEGGTKTLALKLKVVCENSKNLLIADEETGRTCVVDRNSWTKICQGDSSSEKKIEKFANTDVEEAKGEETTCPLVATPNSKSKNSVFDKEDENSSVNKIPELEVKVSTVLQKEEKASQSSESRDSLLSEEFENDSSLDEDDIEIITKNETDSIPLELTFTPALPRKSRFKIGAKTSRFTASLLRKKGIKKSPQSSASSVKLESSDISERESKESSLSSLPSSGSDSEVKKNPSVKEQPAQESSSDDRKDVDPDNNPTAALRSSFMKYLEKNTESEWLTTAKRSEQSKPAEKSCTRKLVPISNQDLKLWLMSRN